MPFLDSIIKDLNNELITRSLNFINAGKIKTYGICETMIGIDGEKQVRYPAEIDNDGEATMVEPDDTYQIIFYHRIENIVNGIVPKTNYGRTSDLLETANMALIVLAFRDQVRRTSYWLEGIIKDQFPDSLNVDDPATLSVLQHSNLRIGNGNFDKIGLLNREYLGVELNFTQLMIFELKYRIESTYRKGCVENCCEGAGNSIPTTL